MNTTLTYVKRSIVSLKLPKSVPALLVKTRSIVDAMTKSPLFPDPDPALSTVTTALAALQAAHGAVLARELGAVALRNEKRRALVVLLDRLGGYIQGVADGDVSTAASVIESAGVGVRTVRYRQKQVFAVKHGPVSGSVTLTTRAVARRASYLWQYSLDGGKTWVDMPATLPSKTTLFGLTPATKATFRSRAVTKAGEGDWGQEVSIVVL